MEEDLKKLGKQELIDIIKSLDDEIRSLRAENKDLREKANGREIKIADCGSIAEASLAISNVFARAQKAADLYLDNIKRLESETAEKCAGLEKAAELKAEELIVSTEKHCDELMQTAVVHANEALNRAAAICAEKLGEADAVLKSAHQDSADIRDAALRFFMERSTNAALHLSGGASPANGIIPDITVDAPEDTNETEG